MTYIFTALGLFPLAIGVFFWLLARDVIDALRSCRGPDDPRDYARTHIDIHG